MYLKIADRNFWPDNLVLVPINSVLDNWQANSVIKSIGISDNDSFRSFGATLGISVITEDKKVEHEIGEGSKA